MRDDRPSGATAPFPLWPLAALASGFFVLGVASLSVIGLAHDMARDLAVPEQAIAHLVTLYALVYALAAPALQVLCRDQPPKRLILCGLLLIASGSALGALAPDYGTLLASRLIMGVGGALTGPLSLATGGFMVPEAQRGRALATVFGGLTLATVLGMPLTAWLGLLVGWREATWLLAGAALLAALLVWRLVPAARGLAGPTFSTLLATLRNVGTMLAISVSLLQICAQFVTYALLGGFLQARFAAGVELLPLALLLFGLGGVVGNLLGGWWSDRARPERVVLAALLLLALFFVLLALAPAQPWIGLAIGMGWAVVGLTFQPAQQKRLILRQPTSAGLILALNGSAVYLGMSLGAALAGWSAGGLGFASLPLVSLAVTLLAIAANLAAAHLTERG